MNLFLKGLMGALIFLDCVINVILGGSFHETLSSRAHGVRMRKQPYWWWVANVIDWLFWFQPNHCEMQYWREGRHGGVWNAWKAL